ncbi:DUF2333 family protein [Paraglaciecola sp. Hal342]
MTDAQPKLNIDHRSWLLPSAESQYQDAIDKLYCSSEPIDQSSR